MKISSAYLCDISNDADSGGMEQIHSNSHIRIG